MNRQQAKDFREHYEKDERGGYHIKEQYSVYVPEFKDLCCFEEGPINNFSVIGGLFTFYPFHWWDGASGPAIDKVSNMRASLIHDAIYTLIELSELDEKKYRKIADRVFFRFLKEDGEIKPISLLYYKTVRMFGGLFIKGKR